MQRSAKKATHENRFNLIYKNKKYIIRKNYRYKFKNIISKIIIVMKLYK